jgi:arginine deiminase
LEIKLNLKFGASCEYHSLKRVLMFRPGIEVKQITIHSFKELAFRDVAYWKRFQKEHDNFCTILKDEKIDVVYLNDLLNDKDQSLVDPNMVYIRDAGAITEKGFIQMRMASHIRTIEPILVANAITKLEIPIIHQAKSPDLLEGGDFIFPDEKTLFIGYGPRTTEEGAIRLTNTLLRNSIQTIVHVPLPSWRVHLDGGLMFVAKDLILYHPASVTTFPVRVYKKNEPMEIIHLMEFLSNNFQCEKIPITDNELYLFGANVVCLNARKCVIYEHNERIIKELEQYGIEALPIQGSELSRGGGGPHCMTLPILREP